MFTPALRPAASAYYPCRTAIQLLFGRGLTGCEDVPVGKLGVIHLVRVLRDEVMQPMERWVLPGGALEDADRVGVAPAPRVELGKAYIGVDETRIELDGLFKMGLGLFVIAPGSPLQGHSKPQTGKVQ